MSHEGSTESSLPVTTDAARTIPWRECDLTALRLGDQITGFTNLTELDLVFHNVGRRLLGQEPLSELPPLGPPNNNGQQIYEGWYPQCHPPSKRVIPPNFTGPVREIAVWALGESIPTPGKRLLPREMFVVTTKILVRRGGSLVAEKVATGCVVSLQPPRSISLAYPESRVMLRGQSELQCRIGKAAIQGASHAGKPLRYEGWEVFGRGRLRTKRSGM